MKKDFLTYVLTSPKRVGRSYVPLVSFIIVSILLITAIYLFIFEAIPISIFGEDILYKNNEEPLSLVVKFSYEYLYIAVNFFVEAIVFFSFILVIWKKGEGIYLTYTEIGAMFLEKIGLMFKLSLMLATPFFIISQLIFLSFGKGFDFQFNRNYLVEFKTIYWIIDFFVHTIFIIILGYSIALIMLKKLTIYQSLKTTLSEYLCQDIRYFLTIFTLIIVPFVIFTIAQLPYIYVNLGFQNEELVLFLSLFLIPSLIAPIINILITTFVVTMIVFHVIKELAKEAYYYE